MHWFWRAVVSLAISCAVVALIGGVGRIERDITDVAFLLSVLLLPFASFAVVSYLTFEQKRFPPPS
jgi:hypothetical protein